MNLRTRQYDAFKKRPEHARKIAPIPIKSTSLLYEVHKITKKRSGKSGFEYFASWTGYPSSDDSWITELPSYFEGQWGNKQGATTPDTTKFHLLVEVACQRLDELVSG